MGDTGQADKKKSKSETEDAASREKKSKSGLKRGWDEIECLFESKKKDKQDRSSQEKNARDGKRNHDSDARQRSPTKKSKPNLGTSGSAGWVDDGLGGVYNSEGYTGRVEDGVRIFKAHILSKPNAGNSALCPFDCDCCYI